MSFEIAQIHFLWSVFAPSLSSSLKLPTVDYKLTLPLLIGTLVRSQKLHRLQTSSSLYWAYRNLRTGLQVTWLCAKSGYVDFSSRDDYSSYSSLNTPPPSSPQRTRLESLLTVYAKYKDNAFVNNSVFPLFDKDKTTLWPSLRFSQTNTSPCLVVFQEKCNVC